MAIVWTKDDGAARQVTLPDLGRDSKFALSLPAGATRVLQTDGSGADLSGAAVIGSDRSIGVWGIVSAFDSTGVLLGESGFAAAGISPGFRIPVDSTQSLNTGIALYNPGPGAATIKREPDRQYRCGQRICHRNARRRCPGDAVRLRRLVRRARRFPRHHESHQYPSRWLRRWCARAMPHPSLLSCKLRRPFRTGCGSIFPQLADGPATTATLRTTFLLTNLSMKPAAVKLTLTTDVGSALVRHHSRHRSQ